MKYHLPLPLVHPYALGGVVLRRNTGSVELTGISDIVTPIAYRYSQELHDRDRAWAFGGGVGIGWKIR